MASDYKVPYTQILDIQPHQNAERLVIGTIYGWQVVLPKDTYNIGDLIVYIPVDSILPKNIEDLVFPPDSKVKLTKSRVRQIKLRGIASQGMVINPKLLESVVNFQYIKPEQDLSVILGIKKYEPEIKQLTLNPYSNPKTRNKNNPHESFHKYNGLENVKWFPDKFKEGDEVVIQEKLHGTHARAGKLPYRANTLWKKFKQLLKLNPTHENLYGSNNVDITSSSNYNGYYGSDIYGAVFNKIDAFDKIKPNETIFGEIIGPGIQKGYSYGLKEHAFVLFDVKILQPDGSQIWLSPDEVEQYAKERGFEMVPILYKGPYNKQLAYQLTFGPSEYGDKSEKVREGIVIKAAKNYSIDGNKQALKWVSEDYLANSNNTDFH